MTKRRKIVVLIATAAVLLALALTVWFPGRTPPVKGLSSQDIREIRRRVRVEVWQGHMTRLPHRLLHTNLKNIPFIMRESFLTTAEPPQRWDNVSGQKNGESAVWPDHNWIVPTSDGQLYWVQKIDGHWRLNRYWASAAE